MIEPDEEFSDTLEFDPARIRRAIDAGRAAVEEMWHLIEPLAGGARKRFIGGGFAGY